MRGRRIIDYTICYIDLDEDDCEYVKKLIGDGWEPYGNPIYFKDNLKTVETPYLIQSMVKYE